MMNKCPAAGNRRPERSNGSTTDWRVSRQIATASCNRPVSPGNDRLPNGRIEGIPEVPGDLSQLLGLDEVAFSSAFISEGQMIPPEPLEHGSAQ